MKNKLTKYLIASLLSLPCMVMAQEAEHSNYEENMRIARQHLYHHMGSQNHSMIYADRMEYQSNEGDTVLLWDVNAWTGNDINKLWFKLEGEYLTEHDETEEAEIQVLYSHAVSPFFDLQIGYRYDIKPDPSKHYAVFGFQGLAPYWIETDMAAFLSDDGDVSARVELEYEILFTQRLILQPRAEFNLYAQDVPELGIGSGMSSLETGLRLRYEIRRELAPYIGISWKRLFSETADYAREQGESIDTLSLVGGIRFWF